MVGKAPEVKKAEPPTKTSKESWFSVPSNPWNAEIEKANRLASTWDTAEPVAVPPVANNGAEKATETVSETTQNVIQKSTLPATTREAIREVATKDAADANIPSQHSTYDEA